MNFLTKWFIAVAMLLAVLIVTPVVVGRAQEMGGETTDPESGEVVQEFSEELPAAETIRAVSVQNVRRLGRDVAIDRRARHRCEAQVFRVDISTRTSAGERVVFRGDGDVPYEMEIGDLPDGINIVFAGGDHLHRAGLGDQMLDLTITREEHAQKGNFTIPIVYTRRGGGESSIVCQMNIINL